MNRNRYKEIDIFRAMGALLVAMYHFFVVSGYKTTGINQLDVFLSYGGEIGVTLFFVISGFSIYTSLKNSEDSGEKITFKEFIKKRLRRIYPQYILCIFIVLFVGDSAVYLASMHLPSLLSHLFLTHNFSLTTHGSISGVLWTMGVIFQFYLIAMLLYKLVKKNWKITLLLAIIVTVFLKFVLYGHFGAKELPESYYFIYGRQLVTALDNFAMGMCLARVTPSIKKTGSLIGVFSSLLGLYIWAVYITPKYVIYSASLMSYIWHTVTAVLLTVCMFTFLNANWKENIIFKGLVFIGKIEYGIYLWHLLIANNLIAKSAFIQNVLGYGYWGFAIILLGISILAGWLSCNLTIRRNINE